MTPQLYVLPDGRHIAVGPHAGLIHLDRAGADMDPPDHAVLLEQSTLGDHHARVEEDLRQARAQSAARLKLLEQAADDGNAAVEQRDAALAERDEARQIARVLARVAAAWDGGDVRRSLNHRGLDLTELPDWLTDERPGTGLGGLAQDFQDPQHPWIAAARHARDIALAIQHDNPDLKDAL